MDEKLPISLNEPPTPGIAVEPGSFRDREARVYYQGGRIFRGLSASAAQEWEFLRQSRFFKEATTSGAIVKTSDAPDDVLQQLKSQAGWEAVLEHEAIPFTAPVYAWSFHMLKDAALLHLRLLLSALEEGMFTKDGTPYNIQFNGVRPVFIDIPSFVRRPAGAPWAGYDQFCRQFLYPLMLQSFRKVPFQPFLRGRMDGMTAAEMWNLLSIGDLVRRGVGLHVFLQALLHRSNLESQQIQRSTQGTLHHESMQKLTRNLLRAVQATSWRPATSEWTDYNEKTYSEAEREQRRAFVEEAAATRRWGLAWDLGCNDGRFSRLISRHCDYVVAMDADDVVVDALYRALDGEKVTNILPLVCDLADPFPSTGWRNAERRGFSQSRKPDLVLALAVVHHLVISRNIRVDELVSWLAELKAALVVEFVRPEDPMAAGMLAGREDAFPDYRESVFEAALAARFNVQKRLELQDGKRVLYFAVPQ